MSMAWGKWMTCREGSLVGRKSGRYLGPEKPEVAGVATVAGAVTPAPVSPDPLEPSSPNLDQRKGAATVHAQLSPRFPDWPFNVLLVVTVLLWVGVGIVIFNLWKLGVI